MKKGSKHINQKLHDSYPKPEVPADAAWAKMNDMLNTSLQVKKPWNWSKFFMSTFVCSVIAVSAYYFWPKASSDTPRHKTIEVNNRQEISADVSVRRDSNSLADSPGEEQHATDHLKETSEEKDKQSVSPQYKTSDQHSSGTAGETGSLFAKHLNEKAEPATTAKRKGDSFYIRKKENRRDDETYQIEKDIKPGSQPKNKLMSRGATDSQKDLSSQSKVTTHTQSNIVNLHTLDNKPAHFGKALPYPRIGINNNNQNKKASEDKPSRSLFHNTGVGLQWQSTIPMSGTEHFLTTGEENDRVYKLLIPGISVSQSFGERNHLRLTFLPYGQYFTKNALIAGAQNEGSDSTTVITNRTSLIKTRGWNVALGYERTVLTNFGVGAGIYVHKQTHALLSNATITSNDSLTTYQSALTNRKYEATDGYFNQ
ncbi:MAG TPA: hypothetical protein VGN64_11535, partial [Dyadobacter sp.]|nr:hypothetical protein [Dyadobacter sp.]